MLSLRYLTNIFDKVLEYAGGVEPYKEMNGRDKDYLFLSLYNSIIQISARKMANIGKVHHHSFDVSNNLDSPDIEAMIRQVSSTLSFPKTTVPETNQNQTVEPVNSSQKIESITREIHENENKVPISSTLSSATAQNKNVSSKACCIS